MKEATLFYPGGQATHSSITELPHGRNVGRKALMLAIGVVPPNISAKYSTDAGLSQCCFLRLPNCDRGQTSRYWFVNNSFLALENCDGSSTQRCNQLSLTRHLPKLDRGLQPS